MIELQQVERIAGEIARDRLGKDRVIRVMGEPVANSAGEDAIGITIVIEPGAVDKIEGGALLDTLVDIQEGLQAAGEQRLAIVGYATDEELEQDGYPQS